MDTSRAYAIAQERAQERLRAPIETTMTIAIGLNAIAEAIRDLAAAHRGERYVPDSSLASMVRAGADLPAGIELKW